MSDKEKRTKILTEIIYAAGEIQKLEVTTNLDVLVNLLVELVENTEKISLEYPSQNLSFDEVMILIQKDQQKDITPSLTCLKFITEINDHSFTISHNESPTIIYKHVASGRYLKITKNIYSGDITSISAQEVYKHLKNVIEWDTINHKFICPKIKKCKM